MKLDRMKLDRMKLDRLMLLLLVGMAMLAAACEETLPASDVPYVEQVIVQGMITADSTHDTIRFVRTLPLNQIYDSSQAELNDVSAVIVEEQTQKVFPLRPVGRGAYVIPGLVPAVGQTYTLKATWRNAYHITGSTTVPPRPVIEDTYAKKRPDTTMWIGGVPQQGYYLETTVLPVANVGYGLRYQIIIGSGPGAGDMSSSYSYQHDEVLKRAEDAADDGRLHLRPGEWSGTFIDPPPVPVMVTVSAFDHTYYDYYMTRRNDDDADEVFGAPGEKTRWNVTGDGFGLFSSRSISTRVGVAELAD